MLETRKIWGHVATLLVFLAITGAVLVVLFRLAAAISFGQTTDVSAVVPQAGSLSQGTSVTMAGARVGTVQQVERRGVGALVKLRIDNPDVQPIAKDTTAQLSVRTPLGENYVELIPGQSEQEVGDDDVLDPAENYEYVDVDQVLSTLKGRTRDRARNLIGGLGTAVDGRGTELNTSLRHAASILDAGSGLTARIKGDRERIGALVDQLGTVTRAIGERGESVQQLAREGVQTFDAIAQRDESVRALLTQLPPTLRQVRTTTGTLGSVSDDAAPVLRNLATAIEEAEPTVRRLQPVARSGTQLVRNLADAAPPLERTLAAARTASGPVSKALPQVRRVLCQANPALEYLEPYTPDIIAFATGLGASANAYDAVGHTIRLMPVVGENSTLGLPDEVSKASFELTRTGFFQEAQGLSFNPFPEPGQGNTGLTKDTPSVLGPSEVKEKLGYTYPRIKAAC